MNETMQGSTATTDHPLSVVATNFGKMTRGTLSDRAYVAMRRAILTGDLPPRTRLPEGELATLIPVSRTPIREALRRLRDEGLLVNSDNRVLEVRGLDLRETLHTYQILEALEPLAARLATSRITDEEIAFLRESVDLTEFFFEKERWDDVTKESRRYHELIYDASGNDRLAQLIRRLREDVHRYRRFHTRDTALARQALIEDREIIDALAERNADKAYRIMYEHIHVSTEHIQALMTDGVSLEQER